MHIAMLTGLLAATVTAGPLLATPALAAPAATPRTATAPALTGVPDPGGITLTGADVKRIRLNRLQLPAWKIALNFAMEQRGVPYVWGGTGRGGYDCSGLMLRAYQAAGVTLPRVAASQYHAFSQKISWDELRPGDLVFFSGLGHVGMISRPGHMVHAPRSGDVVKEEPLSQWRRDAFVGAVRPDPKGVRRWVHIRELRRAPAPTMPVATL